MARLAAAGVLFHSALLLLSQLPLSAATSSSQTCYWPSGNPTTDGTRCSTASGDSFCCPAGFLCLESKLCQDPRYPADPGRFVRGGCTDQSFKSDACPQFCRTLWPNTEEAVYNCGNGRFCCENADCCTNASSNFLSLGVPKVANTAPPTSPGSTILPTATGTTTSIPTPSPSNGGGSGSGSGGSGSSGPSASTLGAAIGVPLGVAAIALVAGLLWYRRRRAANRRAGGGPAVEADSHMIPMDGEQPVEKREKRIPLTPTGPGGVYELGDSSPAVELAGGRGRNAELAAQRDSKV